MTGSLQHYRLHILQSNLSFILNLRSCISRFAGSNRRSMQGIHRGFRRNMKCTQQQSMLSTSLSHWHLPHFCHTSMSSGPAWLHHSRIGIERHQRPSKIYSLTLSMWNSAHVSLFYSRDNYIRIGHLLSKALQHISHKQHYLQSYKKHTRPHYTTGSTHHHSPQPLSYKHIALQLDQYFIDQHKASRCKSIQPHRISSLPQNTPHKYLLSWASDQHF
jgi:hypothetical protein